MRSRGSSRVETKKKATRLTSAAVDGSPSAFTNTSAYTASTANLITAPTPQPARTHASPARKGPSKNRVREQQRLEAAVERAEAELATVEEELAAPERWATKYETAKSTARHTAARRAVEDAYAALEAFEAAAPA